MKNSIKVIVCMSWVMVALLVSVPTMAQSFSKQDPNATQFQSTSALQTSGSTYSSNPTLNEDGTAPSPSPSQPGGPRYAPKPINNDEDWKEREGSIGSGISTPIGDAVLPLTLLALAYIGFTALRRRKPAKR